MMDHKQVEDFLVDVVNHQYTFEPVIHVIESHGHPQSQKPDV
ncbi:hypothetical protein URH17368_2085 [Alicyclobacillus hesperidum URH17-3-68]|nr:hypothetical protein [Alicyclobacillus hesperidum]EJY55345.1 hypothetical protein URH17368_2085 [Alicyclobacillus hesperidum URH17-3-68]